MMTGNIEQDKRFEQMLQHALLNKFQKHRAEINRWEDKAKGKHRQHQF
jgi:hypothetical protein